MISVKKLVPSSARSVSSAASPLPTQLVPLLQEPLDKIKEVVGNVLPLSKKRTALEEAEWEDVGGSEGALERELMMQSMETLRVYRPRVALHGPVGMGQSYIAAAALHHLEGYHVQSLDLGSLLADSTRSPEAAIVQLFVEAKRHQPSVVYIPSLVGWCAAVTETARTTVRAMLDTLSPTDPVLLLAVVDGPFSQLPRDVRQWFGPIRENRVALISPSAPQRDAFFDGLLKDIRRPPNEFPDGMKRKKRVLEELPIAPPLEPRQPTAAELAVQQENDQRVVTLLKYRLGPILSELKRKFKRFTKRASDEYNYDFNAPPPPPQVQLVAAAVEVQPEPNGVIDISEDGQPPQPTVEVAVFNQVQEQLIQEPPLFEMDLERMHVELYKGRYLMLEDFLDDIRKIVHNASVRINEDPERLFRAQAMLTAAEVSCQDFDPQFRLECQRMAVRERQRREAFRKNKEKERAAEQPAQNGEYAPGTRRSARHNGQEPEIAITDPVLLERKLKRQRSNGAETTPSEDENGERVAKKSRTDGEDAGPSGEGPHTPTAIAPSLSVRFADDVVLASPGSGMPLDLGEANAQPQEPARRSGFDPALLNPMSPVDAQMSIPTDPPDNPFTAMSSAPENAVPQPEPAPQLNGISNPNDLPADVPAVLDGEGDHPMAPAQPAEAEAPALAEAPESEPPAEVPMEVERSPTPLPDFHLDEDTLTDFKAYLRDATESLNVEQLEQLRATCLGLVWRHRQEWDRAGLLRELREEAEEFVREVQLDDADAGSP
uniref:Threonine dehydratase ) n=1 Tax=Ganoderma boninense TaxID=34458 RepID=A0A5K1K2N0_9APHY|nr:Threonine dehydratase (EC (Threonine deaminase) [Ganoderma boninense]